MKKRPADTPMSPKEAFLESSFAAKPARTMRSLFGGVVLTPSQPCISVRTLHGMWTNATPPLLDQGAPVLAPTPDVITLRRAISLAVGCSE
jgi:hypothetical protein